MILTPSGPRTDLSPLLNFGVPLVLADRTLVSQQADSVLVDNITGACEAVAHLVAGGYERIACITGPLAITTAFQRHVGYNKALQEAGITPDDSLLRVADFRELGGQLAMQELLAGPVRPDAVFVTNHLMTVGALQAIAQAKLSIPSDIAVVSFDDMPWASLLQPPLTAVAQPAYDLGVEGARLLLSRLEGYTGAARTVMLSTTLMVRGSSSAKRLAAARR